jgi:phosphoribosylamine-glycine ligase
MIEQSNLTSSRSRRSKQQILDLLSEFEKSKATAKDFCKQYNISPANFHKWKSRYKSNETGMKKTFGFATLDVISSSSLFAEVKGIRIYQPVSASFLKELLQ